MKVNEDKIIIILLPQYLPIVFISYSFALIHFDRTRNSTHAFAKMTGVGPGRGDDT